MPTLPDRDRNPQEEAVAIVVAAIGVLRTRDGVPLSDDQISERARNAVTALGGTYELVPRDPVEGLRQAKVRFRAAVAGLCDAVPLRSPAPDRKPAPTAADGAGTEGGHSVAPLFDQGGGR